jgi:2-furoate---CoA ligase
MIINYCKYLILRYLYRITTPKALIRFTLKKHGKKVIIFDNEIPITMEELNQNVNRLCHGLLSKGMQKGDILGVLLQNRKEFIEIRLAAYKCGLIFCALIDDFTQKQRLETLNDIKCRVFFYDNRLTNYEIAEIKANTKIEFYVPIHDHSQIQSHYLQLFSENNLEPQISIKPIEISAIGFTSGTTGKSKGILWSHRAWLYSFYHFLLNNNEAPYNMVILHVVPFSTAGSLVILPALASGAKNILMQSFDVEKIAQTIDGEKVTNLVLPPSFLIELWDYFTASKNDYNFTSLKSISVGSAILPGNKWKEMIKTFGPIIQQSYGMAEVLAPIASLRITKPDNKRMNFTSVGKVIPQVKLRLRDLDSNNRGIICLRSRTSATGYWNRNDINWKHFQNGWFITEDIGRFDQKGNLYIIERVANIFKSKGEKVFPRHIEEIIHFFPGIKEVLVTKREEDIIAYISVRRNFKIDTLHLKHFCTELLPEIMRPSAFILLDYLPHSTSGKILKDKLPDIRKRLIRSER